MLVTPQSAGISISTRLRSSSALILAASSSKPRERLSSLMASRSEESYFSLMPLALEHRLRGLRAHLLRRGRSVRRSAAGRAGRGHAGLTRLGHRRLNLLHLLNLLLHLLELQRNGLGVHVRGCRVQMGHQLGGHGREHLLLAHLVLVIQDVVDTQEYRLFVGVLIRDRKST